MNIYPVIDKDDNNSCIGIITSSEDHLSLRNMFYIYKEHDDERSIEGFVEWMNSKGLPTQYFCTQHFII